MAAKVRSLNKVAELEPTGQFRELHELFADGEAGYRRFQEKMQEVRYEFLWRNAESERIAGELVLR